MRLETVLRKAIEKAKKNGYDTDSSGFYLPCDVSKKELSGWFYGQGYPVIIFSHEFAKAFWPGDGSILIRRGTGGEDFDEIPRWKFNLQQMVLEKEPIIYLKKFI